MELKEWVSKYVAVRDKIATIKKAQTEQLAPYNVMLGKLEALIIDELNRIGAESIRTEHGTAYRTMRTSTKVVDWNLTLAFIREHELWELLEARVSKLAVEAIMVETNKAIPGVNVSREQTLGVRRS